MRPHRTISVITATLLALGVGLAGSAAAADRPHSLRVTDLGTLGGTFSDAAAINDRGDVVGYSETARGTIEAFLWRDGRMRGLGDLQLSDINNHGWAVGSVPTEGGTAYHAVLWRDGVTQDLGTLGGRYSYAAAVNDRGQIVGVSQTASGGWHAYLWQHGVMRDLGLDGATDINDRGQVVGGTSLASGYHAYRWDRGDVTDLGALAPEYSEALAVNRLGHAVGRSNHESSYLHAFLYRTTMTDLGTLGGPYSEAVAVNDRDQVVGMSDDAGGQLHGFRWSAGTMTDLGPSVAQVRDINNLGQIAGAAYVDGQPHAAVFA